MVIHRHPSTVEQPERDLVRRGDSISLASARTTPGSSISSPLTILPRSDTTLGRVLLSS